MRSKLLLAFLVLLLVVTGLAAYLAVAVGSELYEARAALSGPVGELERATLLDARAHLAAAEEKLDGVPASLLSLVPVAGHTVRAVDDVAEAMIDVVDAADVLSRKLRALERLRVVEGGTIRRDLLEQLRGPLLRQSATLAELVDVAADGRTGWVPPPLWEVLDELERRASAYQVSAERGADAVALMGPMLGGRGPRTYLVVLVNNAELRGAGGIPSAAGTIRAVEGRLTLGRFRHTVELRGPKPHARLAAPADFRRRFGHYGSDTMFWTQMTFSPDVPDVALVAARAFRKATGERVDGVVIADPRGVAALMPDGAVVRVPGTGREIGRDELAQYMYSGVYAELGGADEGRRKAQLALGREAFDAILEGGGLASRATLEEAARAIAGGHVRIVSFDPEEQRVLTRLDASGDLGATSGDSLLVAAQNFSGDKMDYWLRRRIAHSCGIAEGIARCKAEISLTNRAPRGLTEYVAGTPYAAVEELVEVFVPEAAQVDAISLPEGGLQLDSDRQDGHAVAAGYFRVRPGRRKTLAVEYRLPLGDDGYTLEVLPQPLAHDARLIVTLGAPSGWTFNGEGAVGSGRLRFAGELDRTMRFSAEPVELTGLTALWDRLVRFWREPLF